MNTQVPDRAAKPKKSFKVKPAPDKNDKAQWRGLNEVAQRNDFYRDRFRLLTVIAALSGVLNVLLVLSLIFFFQTMEKEVRYFATTEDGRVIPLVPLARPNLSTPALMSWVAQASTEVLSFGFHDYKRRLQEASRHFTRSGWQSFTKALTESKILDSVRQNLQVVSAAPQSAPVLIQEGLDPLGRYYWVVQFPMMLSYQSGSEKRTQAFVLQLEIVRVPKLESPNGVGINQWLVLPG